MSEAATVGVIRDLLVVAVLALLFALPFYASLRRRADTAWNFEGNVPARPYNWLDAGAVLALLLLLFLSGHSCSAPGSVESRPDRRLCLWKACWPARC